MKKSNYILVIVVLVIIIGGIIYFYVSSDNKQNINTNTDTSRVSIDINAQNNTQTNEINSTTKVPKETQISTYSTRDKG